MTQQTNIAAAFLRVSGAINKLASRVGMISDLETQEKSSVVAALNEVNQLLSRLIDDGVVSQSKTWSSIKIQEQINIALQHLLGGADGSSDSLKELADQIAALAQADNGLLSFSNGQQLTDAQKLQACANIGIGDPSHNYVTALNEVLATGL